MITDQKRIIDIQKEDTVPYGTLISTLVEQGYARVPLVIHRGEFAVRGDIIDVFAINHSHPVRIEFFGDTIESIRSFDVHTQRSISVLHATKISYVDEETRFFTRLPDSCGASLDVVANLTVGSYIVHENYGIGVFQGLQHLSTGSIEGEYLVLEYRDQARVYVPLEQINLVHPYDQVDTPPQLNSLNDYAWKVTKNRAKKATRNIARELLQLYKVRHSQPGHAFSADTVWEIDLERSFPFEETPDQIEAMDAVRGDMERPRPMDRLICGDVGFGKTEVALRAAFKATMDSRQVAVLVPTTVLAEQHYRNFSQRLSNFGLITEVLNRFKTRREQQDILNRLREGKVDIIIGTHRLLQKDVVFKNLGLVVVDEEQRFGVTHKERLKQLRQQVDVLTMTATPIPRTLYMSLSGIRDMSVISTPPKDREPIHTIVGSYDESLIRKAIQKEVERGGQVFYLQNDVRLLNSVAGKLRTLLPDLRVAVAHGQMKGHALERVMVDFLNREYDVLVCSTIIESGLDIPNANTIIIIDADRFGLAQLHQLRGRVGRSTRNAFAYLFYNPAKPLSEDAVKRLTAIEQHASLGAGIDIALKDLQIRGAGNILGAEQHGNIVAVGFDLYCKLLDEAVAEARGEPREEPTVLHAGTMHIPDDYVGDPRQKIALYRRIFSCRNEEQIDDLLAEITDRYGSPPEEVSEFVDALREQLR